MLMQWLIQEPSLIYFRMSKLWQLTFILPHVVTFWVGQIQWIPRWGIKNYLYISLNIVVPWYQSNCRVHHIQCQCAGIYLSRYGGYIKVLSNEWVLSVSMCRYLRYREDVKVLSNEWVLSGSMCRYLGMEESREMICDIIPIFLAARSGIKLCCTAVNRPRNNLNLFHRRGLETVPERRGGRHRHSFKRGVGEYCGCRYTNCPFISSISGSTVQCR